MILYSKEAMVSLGGVSHAQMATTIVQSLAWTNTAFVNSEVALSLNAVFIGEVRYCFAELFPTRLTIGMLLKAISL